MLLTALALLAGTSPLELHWKAPEDCPAADHVETKVLAAIDPDGEPRQTLKVHGRIEPTPDGRFTLELALADSGLRQLDAKSCEELTDAAILIIAIAIDPGAIERLAEPLPPEPPPPEPPLPEPPPPEPPSEETPPEPRPPEPERQQPRPMEPRPPSRLDQLHVDAQLAGGIEVGILPAVGGWVAAGLGLRGRLWRAELEGNYATPSEEASATNPSVRGRFQIWAIAVRGCPVIPTRAVRIPLCAGVEAGGMHGAGRGDFVSANASQSPWVGFIAGAAVIWRPRVVDRRLGFGLRAEGIAALTRPKFGTAQSGTIFTTGPGGARIAALFTVRLR